MKNLSLKLLALIALLAMTFSFCDDPDCDEPIPPKATVGNRTVVFKVFDRVTGTEVTGFQATVINPYKLQEDSVTISGNTITINLTHYGNYSVSIQKDNYLLFENTYLIETPTCEVCGIEYNYDITLIQGAKSVSVTSSPEPQTFVFNQPDNPLKPQNEVSMGIPANTVMKINNVVVDQVDMVATDVPPASLTEKLPETFMLPLGVTTVVPATPTQSINFEPAGLTFSNPVDVFFEIEVPDIPGFKESDLKFVNQDPKTGALEVVPITIVSKRGKRTAKAQIKHFSTWSVVVTNLSTNKSETWTEWQTIFGSPGEALNVPFTMHTNLAQMLLDLFPGVYQSIVKNILCSADPKTGYAPLAKVRYKYYLVQIFYGSELQAEGQIALDALEQQCDYFKHDVGGGGK